MPSKRCRKNKARRKHAAGHGRRPPILGAPVPVPLSAVPGPVSGAGA